MGSTYLVVHAAKVSGFDSGRPRLWSEVQVSGNRLSFSLLGGSNRERTVFLANAPMALALSAHTLRVQLSVYILALRTNVGDT